MEAIAARLEELGDLPLEESSWDSGEPPTAEELEALPQLKAAILARLGLDAPPSGFRAQHFTRMRLLCMLRARKGDMGAAIERAMVCIPAVEKGMSLAKECESAMAKNPWLKLMCDRWLASGCYGLDRRGAPVNYIRLGSVDVEGFVREVGFDFHQAHVRPPIPRPLATAVRSPCG